MKNELVATIRNGVRLAVLFLLVSGTLVLAQDFTVHLKDQDGQPSTQYVSHNAVRYVSSSPVDIDVIYRLDKGTIIHIDHQQKTYSEMTLAEARQIAERRNARMGPREREMMARFGNANSTLSKVGKGETIVGYATDKYSISTPMLHAEAWITPQLELPAGYYDMVTASIGSQVGGYGQFINAMRTSQIKGYMLKSVSTMQSPMMQGVTLTNVATSVEKGQIPAAIFEPPAGYRKIPAN